jgi:hypothetical protein
MSVVFRGKGRKEINDKRRENKRRTDMLKNKAAKNELKVVFNTVYRDQVSALYREVTKPKS